MNILERTLREICGSEERYRVLTTIFSAPQSGFRLRALADASGVDPSNANRLLGRLVDAGICDRRSEHGVILYTARAENPLYEPLCALFRRGSDLQQALRGASERLKGAETVFVYGSTARGEDTPASDIDVFVIGEVSSIDAIAHFRPAQRKFDRKIGVTAASQREILQALGEGRQFEGEVFSGPKLLLKGEVPDAISSAIREVRLESFSRAKGRPGHDKPNARARRRLA